MTEQCVYVIHRWLCKENGSGDSHLSDLIEKVMFVNYWQQENWRDKETGYLRDSFEWLSGTERNPTYILQKEQRIDSCGSRKRSAIA